MRRLLSSWPYVLGVVGLFGLLWAYDLLAWWAESRPDSPWGPLDYKGLYITMRIFVFPILAFTGAAILGLRRGYDPVTLVICLVVGLAIPEPLLPASGLELDWSQKGPLFVAGYLAITHLGIATGIGVRHLERQLRSRRTEPTSARPA